jgi:hypothetical protein
MSLEQKIPIPIGRCHQYRSMFRNYIKTAWRSLWKNKLFSGINISGLAVGIASCPLLLSYVSFQFSYDDFHKNTKDLYRVGLDFYQNNKLDIQSAENYSAIGPALKRDFPEVVDEARLYRFPSQTKFIFKNTLQIILYLQNYL